MVTALMTLPSCLLIISTKLIGGTGASSREPSMKSTAVTWIWSPRCLSSPPAVAASWLISASLLSTIAWLLLSPRSATSRARLTSTAMKSFLTK